MLDKLLAMKSCHALDQVLPNAVLADAQMIGVLKALYREKAIIMFDVGMGKTYMASAYIKMLLNDDSENNFLVFVKKLQTIQTPKDIERLTGVKVMYLNDATKASVRRLAGNEMDSAKIIILTHDFLNSEEGMRVLYQKKERFSSIIIDEAHNLNNARYSNKGSMLKAMMKSFRYRLALTATPIVTDVKQLTRLANVIDPETYPDAEKLARDMIKGRFTIGQDPTFFVEKSRKDLGINEEIRGDVLWVDPQSNQLYTTGAEMHKVCKGPGAVNQALAVATLVKEKKGTRGIVYVNEHAKREWLLPFLEREGIRYACLNGTTPEYERKSVQDCFNSTSEIDVIVTSLTESLNLDCDWIIFYELTANVQQVIGRGYRGLNDKKLMVYFVLTRDTGESDYFVNTVVKNAEKVKDHANKVYRPVFDAYEIVKESGELMTPEDWS